MNNLEQIRNNWKNIILASRRTGKTQAVIEAAKSNPELIVVCATDYLAKILSKQISNKVISVYNPDSAKGTNRPIIFDSDAVIMLLE